MPEPLMIVYEIQNEFPNLRLGQILINAMDDEMDLFYVTDTDLCARLQKLQSKYRWFKENVK